MFTSCFTYTLQTLSCAWLKLVWVNHSQVKKYNWIPHPFEWVIHSTAISLKHLSSWNQQCQWKLYIIQVQWSKWNNNMIMLSLQDYVHSKTNRNQRAVKWFIALTPSCYILMHYLSHSLVQTDIIKGDNGWITAVLGNLLKVYPSFASKNPLWITWTSNLTHVVKPVHPCRGAMCERSLKECKHPSQNHTLKHTKSNFPLLKKRKKRWQTTSWIPKWCYFESVYNIHAYSLLVSNTLHIFLVTKRRRK